MTDAKAARRNSYGQTPSQTVGPYFAYGLTPGQYGYDFPSIVDANAAGPTPAPIITLEGQVFDGNGDVISDAMIETWQANQDGRYASSADTPEDGKSFHGFARVGTGTDAEFRFRVRTIKPGTPSPGEAPHINVLIFARGMPNHHYTRLYFPDDAALHRTDPVLAQVPANRRETLIATRRETSEGVVYRLDIHLQGPKETAFFDV